MAIVAVTTLAVVQATGQSLEEPYIFTPFAGVLAPGHADGSGSEARFNHPLGLAMDDVGNIYVADEGNETIRKLTPEGIVTTIAGMPLQIGDADGTGSAARFWGPWSVAIDPTGIIYVSDGVNQTIRKIKSGGAVTTFAGQVRRAGSANGTGRSASFYYPRGISVDSHGNVYVADSANQMIRKITPEGVVSTLAGRAGTRGSRDGTGNNALFNRPLDVATDLADNVFVADCDNGTIRKITPAGVVTTFAGMAGAWGYQDGFASAARFSNPLGIAIDSAGNVYVTEAGNRALRKITPDGFVTTLTHSNPSDEAASDVVADNAENIYLIVSNSILKGVPARTIQLARTNDVIMENAGFAEIVVTLPAIHTNVVTVNFATIDGTASAGSDYTAAKGTLTFLPGRHTATIRVPILNDSAIEGAETMELNFSDSTNALWAGSAKAIVTIGDNDFLSWDDGVEVNESAGSATVVIRRNGETETALDVKYQTGEPPSDLCCFEARRAMPGVDFVPQKNSLTFGPGDTSKAIQIPVLDNGWSDGKREFFINWGANTNRSTAIFIIDDDGPETLLDTTFTPGIAVLSGDSVNALAVQADGKILVGGSFDLFTPAGTVALARLNSDGSRDLSFVIPTFTAPAGNRAAVTHLVLQTNGQIIVAGNFTNANGLARNGLARLNRNGSVDSDFHSYAGIAVTNEIARPDGTGFFAPWLAAIAVQPDGRIILGGAFSTVNGVGRTNLARLNADGSLDTNFLARSELFQMRLSDMGEVPSLASVTALALKPDGSLLVAGEQGAFIPNGAVNVVRLKTDGSLDESFDVESSERMPFVSSILIQLDGSALVTGDFTSFDHVFRTNVARLTPQSSLDTVFQSPWFPAGTMKTVVTGDGSIFALVRQMNGWGDRSSTLYRFVADGTQDTTFSATTFGGWVGAMVLEPDGKLLVSGSVGWLSPAHRTGLFPGSGLARFHGDLRPPLAQFALTQDPTSSRYSANVAAREDAGVASITVERFGDISTALSVDYATCDGTAIAGINYIVARGTLNFLPRQTTNTIRVQLLNDSRLTGDLDFEVRLSNPSSGGGLGTSVARVRLQETEFGFSPLALAPDIYDFSAVVPVKVSFAGLTVDSEGNVYVVEQSAIKKLIRGGGALILAGEPNASGEADGTGRGARFNYPLSVAADDAGNIFVADTGNKTVRKITSEGVVTTIAEGFYRPVSVAPDNNGNVYVTDPGDHSIRRINRDGSWTTIADGADPGGGHADGPNAQARFRIPWGIAVDRANNVYVADWGNHVIRKITPQGIVSTLAGAPGRPGFVDSRGGFARFTGPQFIGVDRRGNIYVTEPENNTIRKITSEGDVTTIAGRPRIFGEVNGLRSDALSNGLSGIALDTANNIYVVDGSDQIRKGAAGFGLNLTGRIGHSVLIEASTDLLRWTPLQTNTLNGSLSLVDGRVGLHSNRFYRARLKQSSD